MGAALQEPKRESISLKVTAHLNVLTFFGPL